MLKVRKPPGRKFITKEEAEYTVLDNELRKEATEKFLDNLSPKDRSAYLFSLEKGRTHFAKGHNKLAIKALLVAYYIRYPAKSYYD